MLLVLFLVLPLCVSGIFYDSYYGTPLTDEELKQHVKANTTFWCTNDIEPCNETEGRRIDGSCNNLKHPTRGAPHTPFYRVLPAIFDEDFEPRKSESGDSLPLSRYLRTSLLSEGSVPDQTFTQLLTQFLVFMASDVSGPHDTVNYVHWRTYCCLPRGKKDRMCTPNIVPNDDPVHRFSDIRCLNMTRPISFQSAGCVRNDTTPERLDTATPLLDLSTIYGKDLDTLNKKGRLFRGGLLKYEEVDGRIWPPRVKSNKNLCFGNQIPSETRCHSTPDDSTNSLVGINLVAIWFWRQHNFIATELGEINPCWDDDRLFNTARDINIAMALQIYYYELLSTLMGKENLIRDGLISTKPGFRDMYNENVVPQLSLEYPFVMRWVHTIQEGTAKMYDTNGIYMKKIPVTNLTLRTGYLAVDNNIDYLTQGSFRQPTAKFDYIVDPEVSESGLVNFQRAFDVTTNDLAKCRYFGFQPYVRYRERCFGGAYRKFEDLADAIDQERIERLKDVYEHIEDIDLLAGIWLEKPLKDGYVPPTFYCLVVDNLLHNMVSDRHWYERPNRPNAFTLQQLLEVRKVTMAHILCNVGDAVTRIQQNAFKRPSPENMIGSCQELSEIDFWAWEDFNCEIDYDR
ncbi:peroxidase-like [Pectinophora gossypiella]|uniref:peroxidase-like n=1 Tax=Pectinophora gossypiella TaxID=13191 RepID=UPI00214E8AD7|nr:peroxidase-like [Pectinophora gossypiella]